MATRPDTIGEDDGTVPAGCRLTTAGLAGRGRLWPTFLAVQRALADELDELAAALPSAWPPVLLLAEAANTLVRLRTAGQLAQALPDARPQLVQGAGRHLPMPAPGTVADAIAAFMAATDPITTAQGTLNRED